MYVHVPILYITDLCVVKSLAPGDGDGELMKPWSLVRSLVNPSEVSNEKCRQFVYAN